MNDKQADVAEIRDAFEYFDQKGDGKISAGQIGEIARALNTHPTELELSKQCKKFQDKDVRVSFEEFLPIYRSIQKAEKKVTADDLVKGMGFLDRDGQGQVNSAEMRQILMTCGEKMSENEIDTLLTNQEDSQGNINMNQLARMICSDFSD